jgi:hypothetical protein
MEDEGSAFGLSTQQRFATSISSRESQHSLLMVPTTAWRLESYSLNLPALGIPQEGQPFQLILVEVDLDRVLAEIPLSGLELLLIDLAARIALAQDVQCGVGPGLTALTYQPAYAQH